MCHDGEPITWQTFIWHLSLESKRGTANGSNICLVHPSSTNLKRHVDDVTPTQDMEEFSRRLRAGGRQLLGYTMGSDSCASRGCSAITSSLDDCTSAYNSATGNSLTASSQSAHNRPYGCYFKSAGTKLVFNTDTAGSGYTNHTQPHS
ncbi:hypothetical protein CYMTET_2979 [Cymbomonas tetramitiformis]|uniref:Uncharacterized protein n=1 Tax=Cymbomonas tetramitiformis TaxID=36881 RepID=A0AAE0LM06_9CHLO|nr:hypothetical protein CYMTET_2979 [Cymbomonas tetramitiformis]